MSDNSSPVPIGGMPTRVGKYKILRQIAQGGMAEIYLATAEGIERFEKLVVLKRILPMLAGNREFVEMFLDEARIAGSLLHSNIAQVFDIGSDSGNYYFVMEFLRGEDVRHLLMKSVERRESIPYEHIVTVITGICSGLHYAHEMRGRDGQQLSIVHRDISPQNIFVTHDGNVKLCDFGIAKSAAQLTETRVGTLKGKIRYMSPEQCQAEPLDRRSDVFALSVVLWELITQRRLFRGKSDFEVFKAICEDDAPKPSEFRRDVHPVLESIVMKGLERDRERRYQTAQELQLALEDWSRAERVPASPVRLASYMKDLFGVPPLPTENILEQMTDADPLAKRIKQLNYIEDSGKSEGNLLSPSLQSDEATTAGVRPSMSPASLSTVSQSSLSTLSEMKDISQLSDSKLLQIDPPPPQRKIPWAILATAAVLLVSGVGLGMSVRRPRPADPVVTPPVVATPVVATPVVATPVVPPPVAIVAPVKPVAPVGTARDSTPVEKEPVTHTAAPHVKRPPKHPGSSTPGKKGQVLDELLPP